MSSLRIHFFPAIILGYLESSCQSTFLHEYYHQVSLVFHVLKEVSWNPLSLFLLLRRQDRKMTSYKGFGPFQLWVKSSLNSLNPSEYTKKEENLAKSILIFQLYSEQGAFPLVIQLHLKSSVKLRRRKPTCILWNLSWNLREFIVQLDQVPHFKNRTI